MINLSIKSEENFLKENELNIKKYIEYKYSFNFLDDKLMYFELFHNQMFFLRIFKNKNGILEVLDQSYIYFSEVIEFIQKENIKKIKDELAIELSLKEFNKTTIKKMKI